MRVPECQSEEDCESVLECMCVCICTVGLSSVNAIITSAAEGRRQSVPSWGRLWILPFFFFPILAVFPHWLPAGPAERMSFLGPGLSQTNL